MRDSIRNKNKNARYNSNSRQGSGAPSANNSICISNYDEWSTNPDNTLFCGRRSDGLRTTTWNSEDDSGSFAVRMASYDDGNDTHTTDEPYNAPDSDTTTLERRRFLHGLVAASTVAASTGGLPTTASGYEKAFPQTLEFNSDGNDAPPIDFGAVREDRIAVQKSRSKKNKPPSNNLLTNPDLIKGKVDIFGSAAWGGALWLLLGSRSNPLVRPIANLLYDETSKKGAWVKGRNEGVFTPVPAAFTLVMGVVFLAIGLVTDVAVLFATQGDVALALQLAGVSFIAGGTLELGRIASGEKMQTREETDRDDMLMEEFEEFAGKRLIVVKGASVHRSEVTSAFRRYYAKYRVENDDYPLVDLEIERLLRGWNNGNGSREDISSAGFLKGVKINTDAEIR